jgi:SIR2-like domain
MPGVQPDANQWRIICERLHDGTCIPFLGAAANVSGNGYQGLPLGDDLALHLMGKLIDADVASLKQLAHVQTRHPALRRGYRDLIRLGLQDLARVSMHLSEDEPDLIKALKEKLPDDCTPSPLLDLLARMTELKLIVTTNYDALMERALEKYQRSFEVVVQPKKGFPLDEHTRLTDRLHQWDGLVVYKLHGSLSEPAGIILTEEDYIEFLTVAADEERGVPKPIQAALTDGMLLFLGYGLQDWDFRTIFKALIEKLDRHQSRHSFAIQKKTTDFWFRFWLAKRVEIFSLDLYGTRGFVERLERTYEKRFELLPKQP